MNNERDEKAEGYARQMARLERLVMFMFANDTVVIPKESAWFAHVDDESGAVMGLREREVYRRDWLGLKSLDEKRGLVFEMHPGEHMHLDDTILEDTFRKYFGPLHNPSTSSSSSSSSSSFSFERPFVNHAEESGGQKILTRPVHLGF